MAVSTISSELQLSHKVTCFHWYTFNKKYIKFWDTAVLVHMIYCFGLIFMDAPVILSCACRPAPQPWF